MMDRFSALLWDIKRKRQEEGLYRQRRLVSNNASFLCFSSNDYLSLGQTEWLSYAFQNAFSTEPIGSGGSMMVCGYHQAHRDLEQAFAQALAVDDCVLFSSGYTANLCIASLLEMIDAAVVVDKAIHASVYDGLRLTQRPFKRFLHNDCDDLNKKLFEMAKETTLPRVILTESIFSMSGQCAPLQVMHEQAARHQAALFVDEAHGFGVLGAHGMGGVVDAGLNQQAVPLRMIPFGKALGASGAIVAGQSAWIDMLLQTRPAIYSTAMSPAYARGVMAGLDAVFGADDRREHLRELIQYFRAKIQQNHLKWRDSLTPIQQLQIGCPYRSMRLSDYLLQQGVICTPMRQPTVARSETGLRIILNYQHQTEHIDRLFQLLHEWSEGE